jgi:hypothetical protein
MSTVLMEMNQKANRFHNYKSEQRNHTDAKKKTDLRVKDIQKKLKGLLLVYHATIQDLQRQVIQMYRKIAVIDSSKNLHGPIQLVRRYLSVGRQKGAIV